MHENTEIRRELQNISYRAAAMDDPAPIASRFIVIPAGIEFFHITESATGRVKGFRRGHASACALARRLERESMASHEGRSGRLTTAQELDPCEPTGMRLIPRGESSPAPFAIDQHDPAHTGTHRLQACRNTASNHHRHIDPTAHRRLAS